LRAIGWVIGEPRGATARLGLKRTTLIAKMKKLGISRPVRQPELDLLGEENETQELWHPFRWSKRTAQSVLGSPKLLKASTFATRMKIVG
jgi:hypothetical protein